MQTDEDDTPTECCRAGADLSDEGPYTAGRRTILDFGATTAAAPALYDEARHLWRLENDLGSAKIGGRAAAIRDAVRELRDFARWAENAAVRAMAQRALDRTIRGRPSGTVTLIKRTTLIAGTA